MCWKGNGEGREAVGLERTREREREGRIDRERELGSEGAREREGGRGGGGGRERETAGWIDGYIASRSPSQLVLPSGSRAPAWACAHARRSSVRQHAHHDNATVTYPRTSSSFPPPCRALSDGVVSLCAGCQVR
jgi:hypothetical protein